MPDPQQERIATQRIVLTIPEMDAVTVHRDSVYRRVDGRTLTMDVYQPPLARSTPPWPVVVLVTGYADTGAEQVFGRPFKAMGSYVSWAELLAACGVVAIAYRNDAPGDDVRALIEHVRHHATNWQIDPQRLALWACSGNVPNALSVLFDAAPGVVSCAALCYGYCLDGEESTWVSDAARRFGFANPNSGRQVQELPNIPLFIVRAGQDVMPGLNPSIDHFVAKALAANLPITAVNLPDAPHAFDCWVDSEASRSVIRQIAGFLVSHLTR